MNIFVLDTNPVIAASYHCDKHVIKMVVQSAQILCTVKRLYGEDAPYRMTHKNHPCVKWAAENTANYYWVVDLMYHLCKQYTARYGKVHKSESIFHKLVPPELMKWSRIKTPFVQCMPDQYKVPNDPVQAYRNYYLGEKRSFATWKNEQPEWWK